MRQNLPVTQKEQSLPEKAILSTTTDLKGTILTASDDFVKISGFSRAELIGQPHNILRHPDVPSQVFADMWYTLKKGRTWSAVVKNRAKNGDHYWVFTRVSARRDANKDINGYMSIRVAPPKREVIAEWDAVYAKVCAIEAALPRDQQVEAGVKAIKEYLASKKHNSLTSYVMTQV